MDKESYNGWCNYATWRVVLEFFYGIDADELPNDADGLKELVIEQLEAELPAESLFTGYAYAFLDDVNWAEIAEWVGAKHKMTEGKIRVFGQHGESVLNILPMNEDDVRVWVEKGSNPSLSDMAYVANDKRIALKEYPKGLHLGVERNDTKIILWSSGPYNDEEESPEPKLTAELTINEEGRFVFFEGPWWALVILASYLEGQLGSEPKIYLLPTKFQSSDELWPFK
jgi:hypothetical protein